MATIVFELFIAGDVLNGARDARSDIELRRDDLARLTDLEVVGLPPSITHGARGTDRSAELIGQRVDLFEVGPSCRAPPETTTFASVSAGRADFTLSFEAN